MDWKGLNQESLMNGWPLPNIKDIIHRLGDKKAHYFAVIDLTQGYWQIPIHEDSQHLTAFRTAEGLYEWTRLGMGLKGAGPYFQYHMTGERHISRADLQSPRSVFRRHNYLG